jgi:hypothetical protein
MPYFALRAWPMSTYPPCRASSSTTPNFFTRHQYLDILIIYTYQIERYHADGLILIGLGLGE